ncbi:MAG: hypothetical protein ACI8V5_003746, partial [Limisphaerales bacterium]
QAGAQAGAVISEENDPTPNIRNRSESASGAVQLCERN